MSAEDQAKFDEWVEAITRFANEFPVQAERLTVKANGGSRRRPYWCIPLSITSSDRRTLASATIAVDPAGGWRWIDAKGKETPAPAAAGLAAATDPTYSTYESFQRFLSA